MQLAELKENLELLGDWEDRYRYLIELGRKLPPLPDELRTEQSKVDGCMSQVWIVPQASDGQPRKLTFLADSDAHIVKGLIAVLLIIYGNRTPEEILAIDVALPFEELGLERHISLNRRNGFFAMVGRIQDAARTCAGRARGRSPD